MQNDTSKDIRLSNGKVYYLDKSEEPNGCFGCAFDYDYKTCHSANEIQECTVHVYKERIQNEIREESVKTYTDKHGKVYAIVQAEGCRGCDFYKDVTTCMEAPDCEGINYKEISEEHYNNKIKDETVSTVSTQSAQKKAHKHAELIKQWSYGAEVQCECPITGDWIDEQKPQWYEHWVYRIKPEENKPPVVRWLWSYVCGGRWYKSEFFRTEEEILQEHDKSSVIKLEWSRTEFPE